MHRTNSASLEEPSHVHHYRPLFWFTRGHVTSPPPTPSSQLDTGGNIHRGDDAATGSQPPLAPRQQASLHHGL